MSEVISTKRLIIISVVLLILLLGLKAVNAADLSQSISSFPSLDRVTNFTTVDDKSFELKPSKLSMKLYSEDRALFTITSTTEIRPVGDITLTKEWGYVNGGIETLVSSRPLVGVGRSICINEPVKIGLTNHYKDCVFYPDVFDEKNNSLVTIIRNNAYSYNIYYPNNYDPVLISTTDLAAYYPLNESSGATTYDWSGNGNDMTFTASAMTWQTVDCINGNICLDSKGVDSSTGLDIIINNNNQNWTMIGWFKPYECDGDRSQDRFYDQQKAMWIKWSGDGLEIQYEMRDGAGSFKTITSPNGCHIGEWRLGEVFYDGTNDIFGARENCTSIGANQSHSGAFNGLDRYLAIGGEYNGNYGNGSQSEFAVYNRLLTTGECLTYLSTTSGTGGGTPDTTQPPTSTYIYPKNRIFYNQTWMNLTGLGVDNENQTLTGKFYINGSANATNSTLQNNTAWTVNQSFAYSNYTVFFEVCDQNATKGCTNSTEYWFLLLYDPGATHVNDNPSASILYPPNASTHGHNWMNFSLLGTDPDGTSLSGKLYINATLNATNTSMVNNTAWLYNMSAPYDKYISILQVCDINDSCVNSTAITFTLTSSCVPSWTNTSWTPWVDMAVGGYICQINDSKKQNRSLTEYDTNCGSANKTYHDYQWVYCNNCSYSIDYTAWSAWTNISASCGNRTRNYWDANHATCCAITGLPTDCIESDNTTWTGNYTATDTQTCTTGVDDMNTAILILLPMILGLLLVIIAASMKSEEHDIFKIFLSLLSVVTFFSSAHLAVASGTIPSNMQDALGTTVFWVGLVFSVMIFYYLIYVFIKSIRTAAQNKKERLEY